MSFPLKKTWINHQACGPQQSQEPQDVGIMPKIKGHDLISPRVPAPTPPPTQKKPWDPMKFLEYLQVILLNHRISDLLPSKSWVFTFRHQGNGVFPLPESQELLCKGHITTKSKRIYMYVYIYIYYIYICIMYTIYKFRIIQICIILYIGFVTIRSL